MNRPPAADAALSSGPFDDFENHCWRDVVPAEVLEIYQTYRRPTGVAGKAALLAVDLFAAVFPSGPCTLAEATKADSRSCGPYAWAAMPVIAKLLAMFRDRNQPVMFSTTEIDATTRRPLGRTTYRDAAGLDAPADWTDVYALHPDFTPRPTEPVIAKARASAFFGTDLAGELHARDIETLVVCGESTSGCVRATVVDGYSHDFHVVVVEDAVFDRSEISHQVSLFDLHHKYADVMSLAELESHLR